MDVIGLIGMRNSPSKYHAQFRFGLAHKDTVPERDLQFGFGFAHKDAIPGRD